MPVALAVGERGRKKALDGGRKESGVGVRGVGVIVGGGTTVWAERGRGGGEKWLVPGASTLIEVGRAGRELVDLGMSESAIVDVWCVKLMLVVDRVWAE